ncbi:MAG: hypothetical protein J0I93_04235 [Legionella sp.]|nr:hypothetical protein [Legionella sp.]
MQQRLEQLASQYADWDEKKGCYVNRDEIKSQEREEIQRLFSKFIYFELLANGQDTATITQNYEDIYKLFSAQPEVAALIDWLNANTQTNYAMTCLDTNYRKMLHPEDYKELTPVSIEHADEIRHWLINSEKKATQYTEKTLYASFIKLIDQSTEYFSEVQQSAPYGTKHILSSLPVATIGLGASLFLKQLSVLYLLYFVTLKSGQYVSKTDKPKVQEVGKAFEKIAKVSATTTSTLLINLMEMIFLSFRQGYAVSEEVADVLSSLLFAKANQGAITHEEVSELLELARLSISENGDYCHPQIKIVALPLEKHLEHLEKQPFLNYRAGKDKLKKVKCLLKDLQRIDGDKKKNIEEKLQQIRELLPQNGQDSAIWQGATGEALTRAKATLFILEEFFYPKPTVINHSDDNTLTNKITMDYF